MVATRTSLPACVERERGGGERVVRGERMYVVKGWWQPGRLYLRVCRERGGVVRGWCVEKEGGR